MRVLLLTAICAQAFFYSYAQRNVRAVRNSNTKVVQSPLQFISPTGGSIRRGRSTIIEWQGGTIGQAKELSLYQGDMRIASFGQMKDVWLYKWKVSKDLPKGDDYTFHLTGEGEPLVSNSFRIKPRVPLLVKLSPLLLVAAIIPFINKSEEGPSSIGPLPGAPIPE